GDLFFFSSRRRHTRFSRDWSSDVCSSDLAAVDPLELRRGMVDAVDLLQFLDVHAAAARVRVEAGRDAPVGGAEFIDAAAGPDAERVVQQAEIGVVVHVVAFPRTVPSGRRLPLYGERNRRRKPAIPGGRTVARG